MALESMESDGGGVGAWLESLLPDGLSADDRRSRPRAVLLLRFALFGSAFTLLLIPYFAFVLERPLTAAANFLYAGTLALTPVVLRATRSTEWAAHWVLANAFAVLLVETWVLGGVTSLAYPWIAILPVGGMILSGTRGGMVWTCLAALGLIGIGGANVAGWIASTTPIDPHAVLEIVVSFTAMTVALGSMGALAESRADDLVRGLEAQSEHYRDRSVRDALTGLANRALLIECLMRSQSRCDRLRVSGAFFFIDLDGFKIINDRYGHVIGDEVLCEVARRLRGLVRRSDLAARIGGDEFALIMEGFAGTQAVRMLAQRMAAVLLTPYETSAGPVTLGASIGIALYPLEDAISHEVTRPSFVTPNPETGVDRAEEVIKRADAAMYRAKRAGRLFAFDGSEVDAP